MADRPGPEKERYFTPGDIDRRARAMLGAFPPRGRIPFDPSRAALLVIDMQGVFLDPGSHAFVPSAPTVLPRIVRLVGDFERAGRPVICTRHLNRPEEAGLMALWWGDIISPDDPLSGIVPELDGRGWTLVKRRYDAFHGTDLEGILRREAVAQVVITGVMTHLCCETTARSAFMRDIAVFFAVDGTATYNEELHVGTLRALAHGFATPVLVGQIGGALDRTGDIRLPGRPSAEHVDDVSDGGAV